MSGDLWGGKPYFPISQYYLEKFGQKVVKIPVALAEDCPNRRGLKGMQTCIFCDESGSFAYPESQKKHLDWSAQIEQHRAPIQKRTKASKFLVYFQAYTTSFLALSRLEEAVRGALASPDVVGVVLGTRPDCLSARLLSFLEEIAVQEQRYVSVELGVQSFDDSTLEWMSRGHTAEQSIRAVHRIVREAPHVEVGIHLIFGWPKESDADAQKAAEICNQLPIQNVKLHNLHVLEGTELAQIYRRGEFTPITLEDYSRRIGVFLNHLAPHIALHRLTALASRWQELIAPDWVKYKMQTFQEVLNHLRKEQICQGKYYC